MGEAKAMRLEAVNHVTSINWSWEQWCKLALRSLPPHLHPESFAQRIVPPPIKTSLPILINVIKATPQTCLAAYLLGDSWPSQVDSKHLLPHSALWRKNIQPTYSCLLIFVSPVLGCKFLECRILSCSPLYTQFLCYHLNIAWIWLEKQKFGSH